MLSELKLRDQKVEINGTAEGTDESTEVIPELLEIWRAAMGQIGSTASQSGTSCLPLLYALEQTEFQSAPQARLLATGAHFLALSIAEYVERGIPASRPIGELFVMGEGVRNATLMQSLADRLAFLPIRRLDELGQDRSLLAASIAALAMLHIWHIPLTTNRGEAIPRVLGSITPGSPSNWRRVLHEMLLSVPELLPLREAV